MQGKVTDMTSGNPTKLIFYFALPLMLGNIGQQLYMVVDAIIVGQGVGVSALAALGATDWVYWLFLWSIHGIVNGFSIQIAQRFGAHDAEGLRKAVTMSVVLCGITGVAMTVAGLLLARPLLTIMKTEASIFDGALSYIVTLFWGILVVFAYNMASAILRSLGDGKTPLMAMMVAAGVNIALDLLFVMVFHWGIVGAAVATLIAQLCSFLYCLRAITRIEILRTEFDDWRIDKAVIRRLSYLGYPLAIQHGFIAVGGMVLQSVINSYGYLFVAGFTATNKLYGMLESTAISFGHSMTTYVGQNLGAKKIDRIAQGMRAVLKLSVGVSVAISASMILFGKHILSMFVSKSEQNAAQVIDTAYQYLFIMCLLLVILYLLHAYRSALQGLGNTMAPLVSGILEFLMRIGAALLLPIWLGEFGLFFAEPAAWFGATVVLITAYYREYRRTRMQLTGEGCVPGEAAI